MDMEDIMNCKHENTKDIPYDYKDGTREDVICIDCNESIIDIFEEWIINLSK